MYLMFRCFFSLCCVCVAVFAHAAEPLPSRQLADDLLASTGTAAVFESPAVQKALADPAPFLGQAGAPRFDRLLADAGFRRWQPPRVWVLQARHEGDSEHWENIAPVLEDAVRSRGFTLAAAAPLPSASEAIAFLSPGKPHPGLRGLLAAYDADVLVLLQGRSWTVWHADWERQGSLPASGLDLLPDLVAEVVASAQQWPEARGRAVLQVDGVAGLADFALLQAGLQILPGVQQVHLLRTDKSQVWFAFGTPAVDALPSALEGEPRLVAGPVSLGGLPRRVGEARRLASPLLIRRWAPEKATKLPAPQAGSVQSAPSL
jgi:hypothetical protein